MMVFNRGASFGLIFPAMIYFQVLLTLLLIVFWGKDKRAWGFLLMSLGGVLNILERIFLGGVRDYWRIPMTSVYNNINDYFIAVGFFQLILYFLWKTRQK